MLDESPPSLSPSPPLQTPPSSISRRSSELSFHIASTNSPMLQSALKSVSTVLSTQNKAITYLVKQYQNSSYSQQQLKASLQILNNCLNQGGKIILSGIGKSYKIAAKTVATLNSLSVHSALLHPSEALHGDLGMIREDHNDALILISASGNSPELTALLQHVPSTVPVVLVTCTKVSALSTNPKVKSLLYTELPAKLSEKNLYGLSAPTISTTLCLTLLDAVSIALGELHICDLQVRRKRFGDRHPGGAIGLEYLSKQLTNNDDNTTLKIDEGSEASSNSGEGMLMMGVGNSSRATRPTSGTALSRTPDTSTTSTGQSTPVAPNDVGDVQDQDHESVVFEIADLKLLNAIKLSDSKHTVDKLPDNELELLQLITMYDYIVLAEDGQGTRAVDSVTVHGIYRTCKLQGDEWSETMWKVEDAFIRV